MREKHRLSLLLLSLVLGLALVFGCSDDDDDDTPTDPNGGDDGGIENVGSITGIVFQANPAFDTIVRSMSRLPMRNMMPAPDSFSRIAWATASDG